MKEICHNCKHKGNQWGVNLINGKKTIPEHHCQHKKIQDKAKETSAWESVRSIFENCKLFEFKEEE